jgi:alkylglycerol monooxygenase
MLRRLTSSAYNRGVGAPRDNDTPRGRTTTGAAARRAFELAFFAGALVSMVWNDVEPGLIGTVSKLVPMGLLIGHLVLRLRAVDVDRAMGVPLLAGLVASAVGDVVIERLFVGGIAAFLVAHVAYLVAMGRPRGTAAPHVIAALPALAVGGTMAWVLVGGSRLPDPLLIPVTVYMTVISMMLARAGGRAFVDVRTSGSRVFLAGAALFVASDALIALSRWVFPLPHARLAILATYFLAQRLLVAGVEPTIHEGPGKAKAPGR